MAESEKPLQQHNMDSFLAFFYAVIVQLRAWAAQHSSPPVQHEDATPSLSPLNEWRLMLEAEPCDEDDSDQPVNDNNENRTEPNETEAVELPQQITLTITILKRCIHNLTATKRVNICLVLDTISIGLQVLAGWTDQLLPLVHLLWSPYVTRCKDPDIVVDRKCFAVLQQLSDLAKDFLYQRTTK